MPVKTLCRVLLAGCAGLLSMAAAAAGLPPEVQLALARARLPAEALSVVVEEVGASPSLLAWQDEQPRNPASLMKLLTAQAGLELLGPAWVWRTPVWLDGPVKDGVLDGNLVIKGEGDPKLVLERLWLLLRRVQQLGVREIHGDIVLDRSAFTVPAHDPAEFDGEPLRPYNAGADALLLNYRSFVLTFTPDAARGAVWVGVDTPLAGLRIDAPALGGGACDDWRSTLKIDVTDPQHLRFAGAYPAACGERQWPIAYADPKSYDERTLTGLWREMGGQFGGGQVNGQFNGQVGAQVGAPSGGRVREGPAPVVAPNFELVSPTLAELVRDMNKFSNNLIAQQLFLTLGRAQRGAGTPEAGREVLRQWLAERFGAEAAQATVIDNGSGLSRDTRLSARLLARVLQAAWAGPLMPELLASLPIGGVDGTLARSAALPGRARLKTGSLRDAAGIAGVVQGDSGRRWVVVAIVNHPRAKEARPALDALVQWVARR